MEPGSFAKKYLGYFFALAYCLSLLWLASAWYNSFTSFHFFNDLFEWEYMDKGGHFFSSFHLGLFVYKILGDPENLNPTLRKKWICFAGFFLLLPVEVLDGFSANYGASPADLLANGLGGLFCYWHLTFKIFFDTLPKLSFHPTEFSAIRPEMLGSTFPQQVLKDYNGLTYWLALDVNKIFNSQLVPSWLQLTIGYGAEGLLGGHDNVWQNKEGQTLDYSNVLRTKRIFISFDINVNNLRGRSKLFNYLFAPFVLIKFPAPALEINFERGVIFHPIYF